MGRKHVSPKTTGAGPSLRDSLAMLAHDLRNPLMMIRGEVALLRHAEGTRRPVARACAAIDRHVSQIAALVSDLTRVTEPGALDMSGPRQRLDFQAMIAEAVEDASKLAKLRRVRVSLTPSDAPLIVDGNAVRLTQVLATLLTAATRCTKPGRTIRVSTTADATALELRVWDTSRGISTASLPKLFDRLVNDEPDLTSNLGVGMVVARQIVGAHGGVLTAHAQGLGFGCRFAVRLPLSSAADSAR